MDASGPAACGRIALGSCPNKSEIADGRETEVCCIVDDSKPIIMSLRKEIQAAIGRCIINDIDVRNRARPEDSFYCVLQESPSVEIDN